MTNDTPQPPREPEAEGIPDYADDTSTAYDRADRPDLDDSPPALPADRPLGVDEHGVTAAEQRQGESLAEHLAREEPDVGAEARTGDIVPADLAARNPETGYGTLEPGTGVTTGEGESAEEAAMHELAEDDITYEP